MMITVLETTYDLLSIEGRYNKFYLQILRIWGISSIYHKESCYSLLSNVLGERQSI